MWISHLGRFLHTFAIFHKNFHHLPSAHTHIHTIFGNTIVCEYPREMNECVKQHQLLPLRTTKVVAFDFPFSWRLSITLLSLSFVHCVRKNERQRKDSLIPSHAIHFFHSDFYRSSIRFFSFLCGRTLSLFMPGHRSFSLVCVLWEWKRWNIKSCWREWNRMLFALRKQLHLFASTMRCIIEDRGFMYQR